MLLSSLRKFRRQSRTGHASRTRRFSELNYRGPEQLEPRQMLSGSPVSSPDLTFRVVNDATANIAYRYALDGSPQGSSALASADSAPRGAVSSMTGDKTWVIDANRNVYVYGASGALAGSWSAGSMAGTATPEGIATDGRDIWIVDSKSDKVFRYADAASRLSGSQNAASSFNLNSGNTNPKDIVTDGVSLWTVDDGTGSNKFDKVFRYALTGSLQGSWTLDNANKSPTGITFDPLNAADMWIVDSGTDRAYQYTRASTRTSGSQTADSSFALAAANGNAQGIALAHSSLGTSPYQVSWVRQFGTAADDLIGGATLDGSGNVYLSGTTNGSLAVPNPGGDATPFLTELDSSGNTLWLQQDNPISGDPHNGMGLALDNLGNLFQVDQATVPALKNYDTEGTLLWTTQLPQDEWVKAVAKDDLGNAYMSSVQRFPVAGAPSIFVRKFDNTGTLVWERALETGGASYTSSIKADGLGNLYVGGYTYGSTIGPNAGLADGFLAKYSTDGDLLWSREYGTSGYDFAFYLTADTLGNVYTSGGHYATVNDWNTGNQDVFITKFDSSGNQQWTRQLSTTANDQGASLWADNLGNVYGCGYTYGALAGPNQGDSDLFVVKYNSAGDLQWIQQLGTSGHDVAGPRLDSQGNLYLAGSTTGSWGGTNAGGSDALLIKLSTPAAPPPPSAQSSSKLASAKSPSTISSPVGADSAALYAASVDQLLAEPKNTWTRKSRIRLTAI